jgi:Na+-translocating ferredoxin:NAD+ oxidoreductase RnfE subunit
MRGILGETLEVRLSRAGILVLVGLAIELLSLTLLETPTGFLLFAIGGGTFLGLGILLFLWSLVARIETNPSD